MSFFPAALTLGPEVSHRMRGNVRDRKRFRIKSSAEAQSFNITGNACPKKRCFDASCFEDSGVVAAAPTT